MPKISTTIFKLISLLEDPSLLYLKFQGGLPWTYQKLNQPWFKNYQINTVLDIGANTGQFSKTILSLMPMAKVYAFEPLPDCFKLLEDVAKSRKNLTIFNLGIGDQSGLLTFERNNYTASSSFLKMTDVHKNNFPYTSDSHSVEVEIMRLDDICGKIDLSGNILVKIDVQGYEDKVIKGGYKTLAKARIVILETSYVRLYENQPLFKDVYKLMVDMGFSCGGVLDQLNSPITGEFLQGDLIFINNRK